MVRIGIWTLNTSPERAFRASKRLLTRFWVIWMSRGSDMNESSTSQICESLWTLSTAESTQHKTYPAKNIQIPHWQLLVVVFNQQQGDYVTEVQIQYIDYIHLISTMGWNNCTNRLQNAAAPSNSTSSTCYIVVRKQLFHQAGRRVPKPGGGFSGFCFMSI